MSSRKMLAGEKSDRGNAGRLLLFAVLLVVALALDQVEGQFFTKSSSKSIPRMGRRSDPELAPSLSSALASGSASDQTYVGNRQRQAQFDALLDELAQNLFRITYSQRGVSQSELDSVGAELPTRFEFPPSGAAGPAQQQQRQQQERVYFEPSYSRAGRVREQLGGGRLVGGSRRFATLSEGLSAGKTNQKYVA